MTPAPLHQEAGCKEATVNTEDAGKTPFRRSTGSAGGHEGASPHVPAPGAAAGTVVAPAISVNGTGPGSTEASEELLDVGPAAEEATQMPATLAAMLSNALAVGSPGFTSWPTEPKPEGVGQSGSSGIACLSPDSATAGTPLPACEGCGSRLPLVIALPFRERWV
jgi:hypothetical protein